MDAAEKRAYAELHLAVFLFGFTAILGKLIALPELAIVWWRLLFTCLSLLLVPGVLAGLRGIGPRLRWRLAGIGCIVALHWLCFYGSIKYANASIALICLATSSFFTALIEPLLLRRRFQWLELALGLLIVPGMALVVRVTPADKLTGVVLGVLSALFAVLFSVLNKRIINEVRETSATFVELGAGLLLLSVLAPFYYRWWPDAAFLPPRWIDVSYLLVLALLCTTLAYVLAMRVLRHLSAFASNLTINLEPVYGIAMAWFWLDERAELSPLFLLGVLVILAAVFLHPLLRRRLAH